jgi:rod shape-determining protein MreD
VNTNHQKLSVLVIGLCLALLLWLLPIRGALAFWRPPFVLLLVVYWVLREPQRFGVITAWLVGLSMDVLFGQLLGLHALAMSVAVYLVLIEETRLQHLRLLHQCLFVAVVVLVYQIILLGPNLPGTDVNMLMPLLFQVLSSALLWPVLFILLLRFHGEQW